MITRAAKLLEVKEDELFTFSTTDSFNNDNLLEGVICRKSDHRYGALVIFKINNEETEQIIWATPKLEYPFDRAGKYHWPDCQEILYYEKLDGTNICSYRYLYQEKSYTTYKTRLTAVVKDSGFSDFKSMWEEYYNENPWVKKVIDTNFLHNLSFELFGSRNPITIQYYFPLEVNLLFAVDRTKPVVIPPSKLHLHEDTKLPRRYSFIQDDDSNLTDVYNGFRAKASEKNKNSLLTEGYVMYANTGDPSWKMFKAKPEEIEKIHWTASGVLPKNSLFTTGMNTFESFDEPKLENFLELLKEEYPQELLTKNTFKIQKVWVEVCVRIEFIKSVNTVWKLAIAEGFDVTKDKRETMRFVSQHFPKSIMSKVGTVILKQAGLI